MSRTLSATVAFVPFLFALATGPGSPARADELSNTLETWVQTRSEGDFREAGVTAVTVGEFQYVRDRANSVGGSVLARELIKALEFNRVPIAGDAPFTLSGRYDLGPDGQDPRLLALNVTFLLARQSGERLKEYRNNPFLIRDPVMIAKLTGKTVEIRGRNVAEQRLKLARQVATPTVSVQPAPGGESTTVVRTSARSPYGLEVLVKGPDGSARPQGIRVEGGQAATRLQPGDVYQVRLINDSDEPAAVELLIDGLSVLALHERKELRDGRLIVAPRSSIVIGGWFENERAAGGREFEVGRRVDAIAGKVLPADRVDLGAITASFARAWDVRNRPRDAGQDFRPMNDDEQVATVLGRKIDLPLQVVRYDFDGVRDVISVRYDRGQPADLP